MNKLQKNLTSLHLIPLLLGALAPAALAQGTGFTYQGRLDLGGAPANGLQDLTFSLMNAPTGGAAVGTPLAFDDLAVSNGLFTVTLDFGSNAFDGSPRWIEIGARPGASTGGYIPLAPRQPVTPSPYAIFAGAASASGLVGSVPDSRLSQNVALRTGGNNLSGWQFLHEGGIGIGTTIPSAQLDVRLPGPYAGVAIAGGDLPSGGAAGLESNYSAGTTHLWCAEVNNHVFSVRAGGNVFAAGDVSCVALNITSDRNAKEAFKPVDSREVLDKVAHLPITEWQYKSQSETRHIGPMAQDFRAAFGVGKDERHITSVDADGVALAAIQGLNQKLEEKLEEKTAEVKALEQSVRELRELVSRLAPPAR